MKSNNDPMLFTWNPQAERERHDENRQKFIATMDKERKQHDLGIPQKLPQFICNNDGTVMTLVNLPDSIKAMVADKSIIEVICDHSDLVTGTAHYTLRLSNGRDIKLSIYSKPVPPSLDIPGITYDATENN